MRHDEISLTNEHVEALQELRALCVAVRRERVLDGIRFDLPAGHERRLIDIQSAIFAIDEAIRDEQVVALRSAQHAAVAFGGFPTVQIAGTEAVVSAGRNGVEAPFATGETSPAAASIGGSGWRSYEQWRCSSKKSG